MKYKALSLASISAIAIAGTAYADPFNIRPDSLDLPGVLVVQRVDSSARDNTQYTYTENSLKPFAPLNPQPLKPLPYKSVQRSTHRDFSPDKKWEIYPDSSIQTSTSLVTNKNITHVIEGSGEDLAFAWSPDSQYLAYTTFIPRKHTYFSNRVYILNLATGEKTWIGGGGFTLPIWYTEKEFESAIETRKNQV